MTSSDRGARFRATVLVVDDEQDLGDMLELSLSREGFAVVVAHDGAQALEYLERHHDVDAILSDLSMPRIDGIGLYHELVRRHPHLTRRIAFMTGNTVGSQGREFLDWLPAPLLRKPFRLAEASQMVKRLLEA